MKGQREKEKRKRIQQRREAARPTDGRRVREDFGREQGGRAARRRKMGEKLTQKKKKTGKKRMES
jgi:hypothetical protein